MNDLFTPTEIKLLRKGLELYEAEPVQKGMISSLVGAVLNAGRRDPEVAEAELKAEIAKAQHECDERSASVLRLKVKLLEMSERPSEFAQ